MALSGYFFALCRIFGLTSESEGLWWGDMNRQADTGNQMIRTIFTQEFLCWLGFHVWRGINIGMGCWAQECEHCGKQESGSNRN